MTAVTCRTLFEEPLQDLDCASTPFCTSTASLGSSYHFDGTMIPWPNFQAGVLKFLYEPRTDRLPDSGTPLFARPGNRPALIEHEKLLCAEEKGVEARFSQQVMHGLQHAAELKQFNIRLGDYRATNQSQASSRGRPDFTCMTRIDHSPRFLGECKADFNSDIEEAFEMRESSVKVRKWLASYLKTHKLRYGFVTTYQYTVFVDFPHSAKDEGAESLYYSELIPHHQTYRPGETATVRQIMWYLMLKANSEQQSWKMTPDTAAATKSGLRSGRSSGPHGHGGPHDIGGPHDKGPSSDPNQLPDGPPTGGNNPFITPKKIISANHLHGLGGRHDKGPPSVPKRPGDSRPTGGNNPVVTTKNQIYANHARGPNGFPSQDSDVNGPDVKVLSPETFKRLKRGKLSMQRDGGEAMDWVIAREDQGRPIRIQREKIELCQGPKNKVFVYFGRQEAYLLHVPEGLKAKIAHVANTQASQKMMPTQGHQHRRR